jgi:6-phosphogluconate dehydrogenase
MAEKNGIGIVGISPGSLFMARTLADSGAPVSICALPGEEKPLPEEAASDGRLSFQSCFGELKERLGPSARIFSFLRYQGYADAACALLSDLEAGDLVFEANAFPYDSIEALKARSAATGVLWIPIKAAVCSEEGSGGISIIAGSDDMPEDARELLRSIATRRLDGKLCYAELPDAHLIAAARSTYRGLLDVMLQGYADAYRVLSGLLKMSPFEARMVFSDWCRTELDSPVLHGMRDILGTMDESGEAALDMILDTVKIDSGDLDSLCLSLSFGIPPPLSSAAFTARAVSSLRDERLGASVALSGAGIAMPQGKEFLSDLRDALIASFSLAISQCFAFLQAVSKKLKDCEASEVVSAWAGASLMQGPLLDKAAGILKSQDARRGLILEPEFQRILNRCQSGLRKTVAAIVEAGIAAPVLGSALNLYDSFRSEKLSSNLVSAGLDYFFGVGFERVDRPRGERYHRDWTGDGTVDRRY